MDTREIRVITRTLYQMQGLRIRTGNRIAALYRAKAGLSLHESQIQGDEVASTLKALLLEHEEISNLMAGTTQYMYFTHVSFLHDGMITTPFEFNIIGRYREMIDIEKKTLKYLQSGVRKNRLWKEFFKGIPGCGEQMAAVCITELRPDKAPKASSFWKYAGLDVVNGHGRTSNPEHMVENIYVTKDGKRKRGRRLSYNPILKGKLIGVLSRTMLMAKHGKYYEKYYQARDKITVADSARADLMAKRIMIKAFLKDLWIKWRELEDLPISSQQKIGGKNGTN